MRRNRLGLRNVSYAYPGKLGIATDKGQQNNYPLVLDAPTESYETMLIRWQTGVFEVGADAPEMGNGDMIRGFPVIISLSGGVPVTQVNYIDAPEPIPAAPVATVSNNGYGLTITLVDSGGTPMSLFNLDGTPYEGGSVPTGYSRSTISGIQFTYFGAPVFDNAPAMPLSVRTR